MVYEKINGICKIEYDFNGVSSVLHCEFDVIENNTANKIIGHFFNVTNMKINSTGPYISISGFDIIDHKQDGWMPECRFYVYDYESDSISYYCENFYFEEKDKQDGKQCKD